MSHSRANDPTPATRWPDIDTSRVPEEASKLVRAWRRIFKRWDWLEAAHGAGANPILFGTGISALYEGRDEPMYLILLSMDWTCAIADLGAEYLLDCLQDFKRLDNGDISLQGYPNIIINIHDTVEGNADFTIVKKWDQVLREDGTTDVLYYTGLDEPARLQSQRRSFETIIFDPEIKLDNTEGSRSTEEFYSVKFPFCIAQTETPQAEPLSWAVRLPPKPETYYADPRSYRLVPLDPSKEAYQKSEARMKAIRRTTKGSG